MAKTAVTQQNKRARNGGGKSGGASGKTLIPVKKSSSRSRKDAQHVIELGGKWVVKSARSGRFVTQPYKDKREAIDAGQRLARGSGNDLLIHGPNGQIFQHSPAISAVPEDLIRTIIRSANEKAGKKTASVRRPRKSAKKK